MKLCGDFIDICKSPEESEKQAGVISTHMAYFDDYHWSYFYQFFAWELLNLTLCALTFMYYCLLMNIHKYGISHIMQNYFKPNLDEDIRMYDIDYNFYLFPREIGCAYEHFSPTGSKQITRLRCKVTNQEYNELFHILAAIITFFILCLYCFNLGYIVVKLIHFDYFLPRVSGLKQNKISSRKRLLLLLLKNNLDGLIVQSLISKMYQQNNIKDA